MKKSINKLFENWITSVAEDWGVQKSVVPQELGIIEIENRARWYPLLQTELLKSKVDFNRVSEILVKCIAISHRTERIRLRKFLENKRSAASQITRLVSNRSRTPQEWIRDIDQFLIKAGAAGFCQPDGKPDRSGAALLASVLLTSVSPDQFVDFRQNRWLDLAEEFELETVARSAPYGSRLLWAGRVANQVGKLPYFKKTFAKMWPTCHPAWIVSGFCWNGVSPVRISQNKLKLSLDDEFPEGKITERRHKAKERNRKVVQLAKAIGLEKDEKLRCVVCGFSFLEAYGELGRGFIEAHHKKPVKLLRSDDKTKVSDLALVCANCHRMIHRGATSMSVEELRSLFLAS